MVSIVVSAGFAATYPFLHSVEWLVGLGTIEALCAVFGGPSAMMIVTHSVGIAEQGAAQGAVGTARTATTALAAAVSGALFGVNAALPFIVAAAVVVAVVASLSLTWREV